MTTTTTAAPTTTTTVPAPACSAAGTDFAFPDAPGIPGAVVEKRREIVVATLACDLGGLAALGVPGGFEFSINPNAGESAADYWAVLEDQGYAPLARLLEILALPVAPADLGGSTVYVWPSVAAYGDWESAPVADRVALAALFTDEDLERFADENFYLGSRVGIGEGGDWLWYVAGD